MSTVDKNNVISGSSHRAVNYPGPFVITYTLLRRPTSHGFPDLAALEGTRGELRTRGKRGEWWGEELVVEGVGEIV